MATRSTFLGPLANTGLEPGNRNALKHGGYAHELIESRRVLRKLLRENAEKIELA